jgi:hypothetical protein
MQFLSLLALLTLSVVVNAHGKLMNGYGVADYRSPRSYPNCAPSMYSSPVSYYTARAYSARKKPQIVQT